MNLKKFFVGADKGLSALSSGCAIISGFIVVLIMLATCADVASRLLTGRSIAGVVELSGFAMVLVVFLAVGYAQRINGHVSMSAVVERMPSKAAAIFHIFGMTVAKALVVWMIFETFERAQQSLATGESSFGLVSVTLGPFRAVIVFGLVVLLLEMVRSSILVWLEMKQKEKIVSRAEDAGSML